MIFKRKHAGTDNGANDRKAFGNAEAGTGNSFMAAADAEAAAQAELERRKGLLSKISRPAPVNSAGSSRENKNEAAEGGNEKRTGGRQKRKKGEPFKVVPKNALVSFIKDGYMDSDKATTLIPFLTFCMLLGLIYIGNAHYAEQNVRKIDKLSKEVKELGWEYKSLKADLMYKSKMTELEKKVDTLGLKVLVEPPKKIVVYKNEH